MSEGQPVYLEDRFQGPGMPRLLLVDDDEMMRRCSQRFLKRAGFEVTTAASGAEALAMLERGDIVDVFVIDLEMPEMNGIELMRRLDEVAHSVPRGLWSASQELRQLSDEDLDLAWFVKDKMRPIGELVQALCLAIYGDRTPLDEDGAEAGDKPRRPRAHSDFVRRSDILDEGGEARIIRESSSR